MAKTYTCKCATFGEQFKAFDHFAKHACQGFAEIVPVQGKFNVNYIYYPPKESISLNWLISLLIFNNLD